MHPTVMAAVAAERRADLVRYAERRGGAGLEHTADPSRRAALMTAGSKTAEQMRRRWRRATALGSVRRSTSEPCCA